MSKKALDYVVAVSENPDMADAHVADPDAAMDAHGLSDEDKEVLKSGDLQKIRAHLGDDSPPGCLILIF
jgi:hypothetical protein